MGIRCLCHTSLKLLVRRRGRLRSTTMNFFKYRPAHPFRREREQMGPTKAAQSGNPGRALDGDHLPFRQLIACGTEAVIPGTNEPAQELTAIVSLDGPSGADDLSPGMDAGPAIRKRIKSDPLLHSVAQDVVDPGNLFRRIAD